MNRSSTYHEVSVSSGHTPEVFHGGYKFSMKSIFASIALLLCTRVVLGRVKRAKNYWCSLLRKRVAQLARLQRK